MVLQVLGRDRQRGGPALADCVIAEDQHLLQGLTGPSRERAMARSGGPSASSSQLSLLDSLDPKKSAASRPATATKRAREMISIRTSSWRANARTALRVECRQNPTMSAYRTSPTSPSSAHSSR